MKDILVRNVDITGNQGYVAEQAVFYQRFYGYLICFLKSVEFCCYSVCSSFQINRQTCHSVFIGRFGICFFIYLYGDFLIGGRLAVTVKDFHVKFAFVFIGHCQISCFNQRIDGDCFYDGFCCFWIN